MVVGDGGAQPSVVCGIAAGIIPVACGGQSAPADGGEEVAVIAVVGRAGPVPVHGGDVAHGVIGDGLGHAGGCTGGQTAQFVVLVIERIGTSTVAEHLVCYISRELHGHAVEWILVA